MAENKTTTRGRKPKTEDVKVENTSVVGMDNMARLLEDMQNKC